MNEGNAPDSPTLADQASKLYDLVAGYHVTHLVEIARELGVWDALTRNPGRISAELAETLGVDAFYTDVLCRTALSFGLLDRDGDGWRMAPHFDQILGNPESIFYLALHHGCTWWWPRTTGEYVQHFRAGTTTSYQNHDENFMREVAEALKRLPRIFLDVVLPRLPDSTHDSKAGRAGCSTSVAVAAGRWYRSPRGSPSSRCVGIDVEPYSVELARQLIVERDLTDRCEAREQSVDQVTERGQLRRRHQLPGRPRVRRRA